MKKIIVTLGIILLILGDLTAQDKGEIVVPFSSPSERGKVKVDIRRGTIEVVGTDRKDVLVNYSAKSSSNSENRSSDGLKRIASGSLDLEIIENNNYIEIESSSYSKGVDLKVEVPFNVDLHVETYNNGEIYIYNINGEIVADNYNGGIKADKISGSLVADTYNGAIKVNFLEITPDTPMAFSTYNGDVDLTLPSSFKADLKMKTGRGEIFSGFDFEVKKSEPIQKKEKNSSTYKVYLDDWVRAAVNGGDAEIMIKTYNGDIFLRKR